MLNNITADPQQITEQMNERDEMIGCLHNQLSLIEKTAHEISRTAGIFVRFRMN